MACSDVTQLRCARSLLVTSSLLAMVCFVSFTRQVNSQTTEFTCTTFSSWDAYYSSWFEQYPGYADVNMYPFGTTYCDTNATSAGKANGFNPQITFEIPFYGTTYRSMWISPYGYALLNESSPLTSPPMSYLRISWPNENFPLNNAVDPPLIAPFYAYINYRLGYPYEPSQISWRVLDPQAAGTTSQQQSIMVGMLGQISADVRAATVGTMWFSAQWGVVITYYNVTLYTNTPCSTGPNLQDSCLRNTFQVAIVTDGISTFTVYNYFNLTWLGSQAFQNCDPNTGLNSTLFPNCIPAQMGFNSGFGRGFTSLPYAGTAEEIDMDTLSGSDSTGRWIYQVSGDTVHHGGCTNDSNIGATGSWPLTISPLFGPMFGGNVVNVSGPCFLPGRNVTCRFGSVVVPAYNWGDDMQAMCVQPVLYAVGPITLGVSVDGGLNYYYNTTYTVIQQERIPSYAVEVLNANNDWLNPTTFTLSWNAANLTSSLGLGVTIQLLGYVSNSWTVIYTFTSEAANTGSYTFAYNSRMCMDQNSREVCSTYILGAFRVSISNWPWDPLNPMAMWSAPVPLAWFTNDQMSRSHGVNWAHNTCNTWYNQDSETTNWMSDLPPCPCTLDQSYVDFGRFVETTDCNLANSKQPGGCPRNQDALACYESASSTTSGSNSRCCYNQEGNLMYSGDSANGSISNRADPSGMYPYNNSPNIPSISNWEIDLIPYYACCLWQEDNYDCFNLYMNSRPTQDCKNYSPPGHATAFGDPHFITMDNTLYTFNAWGEFWLLGVRDVPMGGESVSFSMQGRFQQPVNQTWGQIKATVMTAVAMQLNAGTIVTVMTNLFSEKERMLIYVNSTLLNFTEPSQWWQQYPDFTIKNNDKTGSYNNFTILWKIGVGVNIAYATGVMEMFATVPPEFQEQTGGLFGYWNGLQNEDLMPRGSTGYVISPNDAQSLFYSFGMTWIVQPQETIFTYAYRASMNYNYYRNTWFVPYFTATIPQNGTVTEAQVSNLCGADTSCQYDYMVTENETVAIDTHTITLWDAQMRNMSTFVTSCGWLDIPDAVKQEPISYLMGSMVNVLSCMKGFEQSGDQMSYECLGNGVDKGVYTPAIGVTCNYRGHEKEVIIAHHHKEKEIEKHEQEIKELMEILRRLHKQGDAKRRI